MAKKNILDMILNTINDVQAKNKANPREETADPNVFDLIKSKIKGLDERNRTKRQARGKSPVSFLDRIKKEIEGARKENRKDPNVKTAPKSVFDKILNKLDRGAKVQANAGIRKIIQDYDLDVSQVPRNILQEVQSQYVSDRKNFDKQYAQALYKITKKY